MPFPCRWGGHEVLEGNVSGSNSVSPFQPGPSLTALAAALTQITPSLLSSPPSPSPFFHLFFFSGWLRWVFDSCAFCTSSHCNVHLCLRATLVFVPYRSSFIHLFISPSNTRPSFFLQSRPNLSLLFLFCVFWSPHLLRVKLDMVTPYYFTQMNIL